MHHYKPTTFGIKTKEEAEQAFLKQQERDQYLRQYCKDHDINLLEIDGKKYNSNKLEKTLNNFFGREQK